MPMQSLATDTDTAAVTRATALFRGLADPSRLAILLELRKGERRVVDLAAMLSLAQATVSGHLACLRDCGLVTSRPAGRASVYSVAYPAELSELLTAAERLLVLTDEAVAACATHGVARLVPLEAAGG